MLSAQPDGSYRLTGSKFYTTGTIYAEWADVYAKRERPGQEPDFAIALVDTREPEVTVTDDWDGFGQRGTGSGTTSFDAAIVPAEHVLAFGERFPYQTALYQPEPAGGADRHRQGRARGLRRARAQPGAELLPRQRRAGPRRPAGAGPDR
ncbi:acyl-CoA dehydrogenase family protein [Nocardioides convexus]|uniref:acyl-CoA dehydrogenase family protein n=1 Tax=Nocardioides convexus TaxID=2712224 RepID=UPI00241881D5|nr:acyl-CoA dehydrogenase family protein [Nocardioides convexus]